jgi:hypothetical protein
LTRASVAILMHGGHGGGRRPQALRRMHVKGLPSGTGIGARESGPAENRRRPDGAEAVQSADFLGQQGRVRRGWGFSDGVYSRNGFEQDEHKIKPVRSTISAVLLGLGDTT